MKINLSEEFFYLLGEIISFIAKDKPQASREFKKELLLNLKKV